jgi:hypothetical protein
LGEIFRTFFGAKPKAGDIYELDESNEKSNPFRKQSSHLVEVLNVKDGWVNFKYCGSKWYTNESLGVRTFRFCYKPYKIPQCLDRRK